MSSPSLKSTATPLQRKLACLLVLAPVLLADRAAAQQVIEVEAERTVLIDIPADGLALFKTEGAKLLKVRHLQRDLAAEADTDKSEVTIQPLKTTGTAALFLVTETVTIPVNVRIEKGSGAKTVVFKVPPPQARPTQPSVTVRRSAQQHVRLIKDIVVAAAATIVDETVYEVGQVARALPPVGSLLVFHQRTVRSRHGLSADRYIITNPTDQPITLDERKLGTSQTVAIAIDEPDLPPGASALAVVVRSEDEIER